MYSKAVSKEKNGKIEETGKAEAVPLNTAEEHSAANGHDTLQSPNVSGAEVDKSESASLSGEEFLEKFHEIQDEFGIPAAETSDELDEIQLGMAEEEEPNVSEQKSKSSETTGGSAKPKHARFESETADSRKAKSGRNVKKENVAENGTGSENEEKKSGSERNPKNRIPDYECLFESSGTEGNAGMRILKRLFKQNFGQILISTLLQIIKSSAIWAMPVITANIINYASKPTEDSGRLILINVAVLLILIVQNLWTHMMYATYTNGLLRKIGAGLRNTLIKKIQHLSITYHKEIETGRIQAKFLRDIEAIEFFNMHFMKSVIYALLNVVISVAISITKSGIVTLFFLCVVPINVSAVYLFRKKMAKNNRSFRRESENISAKVSTMMDMLPVTKAHGLESEEVTSVSRNIRTLYEKGMALDRTNEYFASVSWIISQCVSLGCLLFTSFLAMNGKIKVGDIVMFQSYFNAISGSVQTLLSIYPELSKGIESARSVSEIMLSNDIEDNKGKLKLRYVHGSIKFEDVCYRYPNTDKDVIKNFSLDVKQGECIAFVGSSGSGKSTIMNMIIGFLKATGGEIFIDGKPISALNLSSYRHFISVVPQNSVLFPGTIKENILYGMENVSEEQFQKVLEQANINEFLPSLEHGIDTYVGEGGGKLSGGQKQRISIARALIRDPRILILDEATSALDNISEYQVQKAISQLIKERTTFMVAHRLSTIRDADRIVVMNNGECVEMGTYDELMAKKGEFYELKRLSEMKAAAIE